jgi:general secretion pathway protein I
MMREDQRVALARISTSFPRRRESNVFEPTTLGSRLAVPRNFALRARLAVPRNFALRARFHGDGCTHPRTRAAGFSLLEVLVAFVILALVGTVLFRLFGASLNNASLSDEYSRAALHAETRLAAAGAEAPLREGTDQGASEDGRYTWSTKVEPYSAPGTTADQERMAQMLPMRLWRLTVTVTWPTDVGGQRTLALSTVRMAMKQPQ